MNFIAGRTVTVKVKNLLWPVRNRYAFHIPQYVFYTGQIVQEKNAAPNEISLTTGYAHFPVRTIKIDRIVQVDHEDVHFAAVMPAAPVSITVTGSKNNTYTVTKHSGGITCTCPGYEFRKTCKHLSMVA